jgi:hypothetical protein
MPLQPLSADQLYHACDLGDLVFETTDDLEPDYSALGQDRATDAIQFAINMPHSGYNLFVSGSAGIGKRLMVSRIIKQVAAQGSAPPDWCYVNNFDEPHQPRVLQLPQGLGHRLRHDLLQLVETLNMGR